MNEGTMVKIGLKHVVRDIDRHGNDRFYFRVKDLAKVRLPGIPGSEEFMETYQEALRRQVQGAVTSCCWAVSTSETVG